jgi:hypothetical protein
MALIASVSSQTRLCRYTRCANSRPAPPGRGVIDATPCRQSLSDLGAHVLCHLKVPAKRG